MEKKRKYKRRGRRVKKTKKQVYGQLFYSLILVVAIAVFALSAFQLFKIYKGYNEGEKEYDEIANIAISTEKDEAGEEQFTVDFDALREINKDVVAWLRFEEPSIINYPVVQGKDNEVYLHKTFKGYDNTVGTLFVDKDNTNDFNDRNTFIYGHYMYNGTMFNDLDKYKDAEFQKEHPYFYIYTPDGMEHKYLVYSAGVVDTAKTLANFQMQFADDADFLNYIEVTKASSNYQVDVEIDATAKVVSLMTCTKNSNDERFLVHAVEVEERSVANE